MDGYHVNRQPHTAAKGRTRPLLGQNQQPNRHQSHGRKQYVVAPTGNRSNHVQSPGWFVSAIVMHDGDCDAPIMGMNPAVSRLWFLNAPLDSFAIIRTEFGCLRASD
jgi:hypothetical protein